MVELVEVIAKSLVEDADAVTVTQNTGKYGPVIMLHVAPDDMGKVIGKQGRIARAIRTVVKAASAKSKETVTVEIV